MKLTRYRAAYGSHFKTIRHSTNMQQRRTSAVRTHNINGRICTACVNLSAKCHADTGNRVSFTVEVIASIFPLGLRETTDNRTYTNSMKACSFISSIMA